MAVYKSIKISQEYSLYSMMQDFDQCLPFMREVTVALG